MLQDLHASGRIIEKYFRFLLVYCAKQFISVDIASVLISSDSVQCEIYVGEFFTKTCKADFLH